MHALVTIRRRRLWNEVDDGKGKKRKKKLEMERTESPSSNLLRHTNSSALRIFLFFYLSSEVSVALGNLGMARGNNFFKMNKGKSIFPSTQQHDFLLAIFSLSFPPKAASVAVHAAACPSFTVIRTKVLR